MGATPIGLILSLIGLLRDKEKRAAVWGIIISGALFALFLVAQWS